MYKDDFYFSFNGSQRRVVPHSNASTLPTGVGAQLCNELNTLTVKVEEENFSPGIIGNSGETVKTVPDETQKCNDSDYKSEKDTVNKSWTKDEKDFVQKQENWI